MDKEKLAKEEATLTAEVAELDALLNDETKVFALIREELLELKNKVGRRERERVEKCRRGKGCWAAPCGAVNESEFRFLRISLAALLTHRRMASSLVACVAQYGGPRRSTLNLVDEGELEEQDLISNDRSVVVVTRNGYIKRMPLDNEFSATQGRGTRGKAGTRLADDDEVPLLLDASFPTF